MAAIQSQVEESQDTGSPPVSKSPLPSYIPELDGLRALAILAVMAYHLNLEGFSLAWTGVLLFFVLSGFLITGILLDARERPNYFRNFYFRRTLRILPIYYLTLLAIALTAFVQRQDLGDLAYYLAYLQNYVLGITDFQARFPMTFNHSWSLAVEEQFYLLWPAVVLILSRRQLVVAILALLAAGLLSRALVLSTTENPTLIYTSLPTQLDSLAVGAGLAVLVRSGLKPRFLAGIGLAVSIASGMLLFLLVRATGTYSFWHIGTWATEARNLPLQTLVALFSGGLLAFAMLGNTVLSFVLRLSFLRHLGRISYGIYMYHFPVFVLADNYLGRLFPHDGSLLAIAGLPLVKVLITYGLALASWHLVESPLLKLKERFL